MVSYRYKPAPPLDRFVDVIWVMESDPTPHPKERLLPDGSVELVFSLHEERFPARPFSAADLDRAAPRTGRVALRHASV